MIRGLSALAVCILLTVPAFAAGKFWTDPQTGVTWTTDPQACGTRFAYGGESWVKILRWTDPQTGAVWITDPRATGPRFTGWGCSWVKILVWVDAATGGIWTTDPSAVGPKWTGGGQTWTNLNPPPPPAPRSGAVYVFGPDAAAAFAQQAYIKASNTDERDNFGILIALSGDTLAVSGLFEDSNATGIDGDQSDNSAFNAAAVYVFTRDGTGVWSQQNYVKASNTDARDIFSKSVALSGDTLAVGANLEDSNATGVDGDQGNSTVNAAVAVDVFVSIPTGNANLASLYLGSDSNVINPNSEDVIQVAVLGSVNFGVTQVDFSTAEFGPGKASPVHDGHIEHVNDDGFFDLVFHFNTQDTGIACGDTEATLSGEIFGGDTFAGTDSVKTAGCK